MKKAKLPSLATVGAYAPGCHSFPRILFPESLSRKLLVGMPGARLELACPLRGDGMTAHCVCRFRHPGISACRLALWAMAPSGNGLSSNPADLRIRLSENGRNGKEIISRLDDREQSRPGRPFLGSLSGEHVRPHRTCACPSAGCQNTTHSSYQTGGDLSGERSKPRLPKRSVCRTSQLRGQPQYTQIRYRVILGLHREVSLSFLACSPCTYYNTQPQQLTGGSENQKIAGLIAPSRLIILLNQTPSRPLFIFKVSLTTPFCSCRVPRFSKRNPVAVSLFSPASGDEKRGLFRSVEVCLGNTEGHHEEGLSPLGLCVAVRGGANEKAPSRAALSSRSGLGPWQPCGPRRFARQDFTPQAVGSDSRAVHPHILTWAQSDKSILGNLI